MRNWRVPGGVRHGWYLSDHLEIIAWGTLSKSAWIFIEEKSEASDLTTNLPQVAPGARVRLAADWGKLHAGDELVVSHLDGPGLVVSPLDAKEELWIPASLIPNSSFSKAWSFRPRKADCERSGVGTTKGPDRKGPPTVLGASSPVRVNAGEVARLSIEVSNVEGAVITWTKEDGNERDVEQDERHQIRQSAGLMYLEILRCRLTDSGVYRCNIQCENGSCSAKISLCVAGEFRRFVFQWMFL